MSGLCIRLYELALRLYRQFLLAKHSAQACILYTVNGFVFLWTQHVSGINFCGFVKSWRTVLQFQYFSRQYLHVLINIVQYND